MSGHSHWATIKRAKGAADAKKGKIFSKLGKEITIVVKAKGGNPDNNPTLRTLIAKAKAAQMPNDNIERAIKKGTGELESAEMVDAQYEGIKGGTAVVVRVLTDNKNRAAADVGHVFKRNGSDFATRGAVSRNFERKGQILIAADAKAGETPVTEDMLMEIALEAGADDIKSTEDGFEITTAPSDYQAVETAIEEKGIPTVSSEIVYLPMEGTTVAVTDKAQARSILKFVEALEENEDVQNVYHNADIPDDIMAALDAE